MYKNLSGKYYQENKERLQNANMVVNVTNISQKLVEYRKKYYRMRKNTLL